MLKSDHLVRGITCAVAVSCGAILFNACSDSSSSGAGGASSSSVATTSQSASSTTTASGSTATSSATASGSTGAATSSSSGGMQNVERCFPFDPEGGACPPYDQAVAAFGKCTTMNEYIVKWDSGPTQTSTECCYQVDVIPNDPNCP